MSALAKPMYATFALCDTADAPGDEGHRIHRPPFSNSLILPFLEGLLAILGLLIL